jgi:hypothetical protein
MAPGILWAARLAIIRWEGDVSVRNKCVERQNRVYRNIARANKIWKTKYINGLRVLLCAALSVRPSRGAWRLGHRWAGLKLISSPTFLRPRRVFSFQRKVQLTWIGSALLEQYYVHAFFSQSKLHTHERMREILRRDKKFEPTKSYWILVIFFEFINLIFEPMNKILSRMIYFLNSWTDF